MDRKHTVLICDDEADLLSIYSSSLKKQYKVLTADSGKACIENYMKYTLRGNKIDILLLDYRLGDSTGDDIACKICELDGTKIILISAMDLEKEKVDKLKASNCIIDAIVKPVSMKALMGKVQQALD